MADTIPDLIVEKAARPASVTADGVTVTQRSLTELEAAARVEARQAMQTGRKTGVRLFKIRDNPAVP